MSRLERLRKFTVCFPHDRTYLFINLFMLSVHIVMFNITLKSERLQSVSCRLDRIGLESDS